MMDSNKKMTNVNVSTLIAYQDYSYTNKSIYNYLNVLLSQNSIIKESVIRYSMNLGEKSPKEKRKKEVINLDPGLFQRSAIDLCSLDCVL